MEDDKLVRMANQVAKYFRSYPDEDAAKGIAEHIVAFWTPGMRKTLATRAIADRTGIDPLVLRAVAGPALPPGESPIRKEIAGPDALGELTSDAG